MSRSYTVGVLVLAIGVSTAALGCKMFFDVARAYRPTDLAVSESPANFQSFVLALRQSGASDQELVAGIRERLLLSHFPIRQWITTSLVYSSIWADYRLEEAELTHLIGIHLKAVEEALLRSPAAPDLWLLAARLRTVLLGFDPKSAEYLRASYIFGPHEVNLMRPRLVLALPVGDQMDEDLREKVKGDISSIQRFDPEHYNAVEPYIPPDLAIDPPPA